MNELRAGTGWYADPTGSHELRYFDGHWADRVATGGVVSTQPLPVASPVTSSAAWPAAVPDPFTGRKRPTKLWALTAADRVDAVAQSHCHE